jgi:Aerotolerance regulator N-terminal
MTMSFLEPALLWGTLAVGVPIALHFWHQKRGQPLPWAITRWLADPNQQPNRGLQFDNWLLLALRCAMLLALVGLLAWPIFTGTNPATIAKKIHLFDSNSLVIKNFRFEIETAKKQNEPIIFLETVSWPILQTAINRINQPNHELHLYLANRQSLANGPPVVVPNRFRLHTITLSGQKPSGIFKLPAANKKPISVQYAYQSSAEKQTVKAGLQALTEVYGFVFQDSNLFSLTQKPDLVLTDNLPKIQPKNASASTLYIVSGKTAESTTPNVVILPDTLTLSTSEMVANGQLPEWLGKQIIRHLGLINNDLSLTKSQLDALFIKTNTEPEQPTVQAAERSPGQTIWLLILVGLITAERWLALRKNA